MKWGLYVALVGSSLACAPWLNDSFGMVKIAVALSGCAILWLNTPREWFCATRMDAPLFACAAVLILSAAMSVSPRLSICGLHTQPFYGLLAMAGIPLVFYGVAASRHEWENGPVLCCAITAIATGAACALEKYGFGLPPFDLVGDLQRAVGTVGNPTFMGAIVATTVPVCLWLARSDSEHYLVGAYGTILGLVAMWASGSRGPWLAAGAGCFASLVASGDIQITRRDVTAFLIVLAAVCATWAYGMNPSDLNRYRTWLIALGGVERYPMLGWGPDTFFVINAVHLKEGVREMQASAHNDILQAWATTGALGLAAYLWVWWSAFKIALTDCLWDESGGRSAAIFGSLVALFVVAKFNPVPPCAFYLAAALLGSIKMVDASGEHGRWIRRLGIVLLLLAPGISLGLVVADGSGTVAVRVR